MRARLNVNGAVFEVVVGSLLHSAFQCSRIVYDKHIRCNWLRRHETQIDLLMVTEKAIYVLETKNWIQSINGNRGDYVWRGYSGQPKGMTVISPFIQNLLHVRLLKAGALGRGVTLPPVYNVICVPDSCMINSDCDEVVHVSGLVHKIQGIEAGLTKRYSLNQTIKIIGECR